MTDQFWQLTWDAVLCLVLIAVAAVVVRVFVAAIAAMWDSVYQRRWGPSPANKQRMEGYKFLGRCRSTDTTFASHHDVFMRSEGRYRVYWRMANGMTIRSWTAFTKGEEDGMLLDPLVGPMILLARKKGLAFK